MQAPMMKDEVSTAAEEALEMPEKASETAEQALATKETAAQAIPATEMADNTHEMMQKAIETQVEPWETKECVPNRTKQDSDVAYGKQMVMVPQLQTQDNGSEAKATATKVAPQTTESLKDEENKGSKEKSQTTKVFACDVLHMFNVRLGKFICVCRAITRSLCSNN